MTTAMTKTSCRKWTRTRRSAWGRESKQSWIRNLHSTIL